jgi:GT2 family glycosyltransferase
LTSAPLVSVIIPCYNQGHFLGAAIESCLRQTLRDIEVLVVDDGSTDGTEFVARAAADRDARVKVTSGPNAGLGAARNRGLAQAQGQYVNFLDADDLLLPTKLERQLDILESSPDVGLVLCDVQLVDGNDRPLPGRLRLDRIEHPDGVFEALLEAGLFPPHVPLVRSELVARAGGFIEDRTLAGHADYLLWLTIALQGARVATVPESLAAYRQTGSSMSTDARHMAASRKQVLTLLAQRHPERMADGIISLSSTLADARYANGVLQETLRASVARDVDLEVKQLRFQNWILTHRHHPIRIWGAGAKGRQVLDTLRTLGVQPAAFVDSAADGAGLLDGLPVEPPGAVSLAGSAVIVASLYHADIVPTLETLGALAYCVAP